jgi:predicted O-methyltransferase YrrM
MGNSFTVDPYSTHLPMLALLVAAYKPKQIVEFGPGNFSTELFLNSGAKVKSIEMQEPAWYQAIKKKHAAQLKNDQLDLNFALGADAFLALEYPDNIDLAFIDGHAASRPETANLMFELNAKIIVVHDFEYKGYGWERMIVNADKYDTLSWKQRDPANDAPGYSHYVETVAFILKKPVL